MNERMRQTLIELAPEELPNDVLYQVFRDRLPRRELHHVGQEDATKDPFNTREKNDRQVPTVE